MEKEVTARQVIDRIRRQCGVTWKDSPSDIFQAGKEEMPVTGIATSYTPSIEVLKKAVAAGKNLIITQQPAWYGQTEEDLGGDAAYLYKKDLIERNGLILWRFYDNWNAREVDGQLAGLAKALGWDRYHLPSASGEGYTKENNSFRLPEGSLRDKVKEIREKLNIPGLRVIGDPSTSIQKATLSHGMFSLAQLQELVKDPGITLIVIAEAIEWESCEYFRDLLTWKGKIKAMILLGREATEDPGYAEVASWLKTFIPEVPVDWIPANEPFRTPL